MFIYVSTNSCQQEARKWAHLNKQTAWCNTVLTTTLILSCTQMSIHVFGRHFEQLLQGVSILTFIIVLFWTYCKLFHEKLLIPVHPSRLLQIFHCTHVNRNFFHSRSFHYTCISISFDRILLNRPVYMNLV